MDPTELLVSSGNSSAPFVASGAPAEEGASRSADATLVPDAGVTHFTGPSAPSLEAAWGSGCWLHRGVPWGLWNGALATGLWMKSASLGPSTCLSSGTPQLILKDSQLEDSTPGVPSRLGHPGQDPQPVQSQSRASVLCPQCAAFMEASLPVA